MPSRVEAFRRLLQIVDRLRAPDGCPWDREQTIESMCPRLVEEAFEVAEAIASGEATHVAEELGDLLMNILLIARIAQDDGDFSLEDVARGIADKLVRRHPHVFGALKTEDVGLIHANWERIKRQEKEAKGQCEGSVLDGVPSGLPALAGAYETGRKAAKVGFDWPDLEGPLAKVEEERRELEEAIRAGDHEEAQRELGDLLFAVVNVARFLKVDPETALRRTTGRFRARFRHIEAGLGARLEEASLEEMEALWDAAKSMEKRPATESNGDA